MENNAGKGQWYVLHTLSGQENRVRENIESQIKLNDPSIPVYEIMIPMEKIIEVKNNVKREVKRKFFPGYVFVRMDLYTPDEQLNEAVWHFIHGVQGVITFSGGGNKPMPLSESEIGLWLTPHAEEENKARPAVTYQIGEHVRIKDGPFENFTAVVVGVDVERGKLKLTVSIFGRSTPIEVEFWQVEREEE